DRSGGDVTAVLDRKVSDRIVSGKGECRVGVWRRGGAGGVHGVGVLLGADLLPGSGVHARIRGAAWIPGGGARRGDGRGSDGGGTDDWTSKAGLRRRSDRRRHSARSGATSQQ